MDPTTPLLADNFDDDERSLLRAMVERARHRATGTAIRDLDLVHQWLRADGPDAPDTDDGGAASPAAPDDDEVALVKEYPTAPSIDLPAATGRPLPVDLHELIVERSSSYAFADISLTLDDLAALLHLATGVKRVVESPDSTVPVRMAPSAGGLQPVNVYVAATRVTGLEPGTYYYEPVRHTLDQIRSTDPHPALAAGCMQDFVATSPATLILTCSLDRVLWHYGSRAYRSVHIDAGVQAHNLMLVATALGLASCAIFGYYDDHLDHLTGIDGRNEITTLLLAIGHPV